MSTSKGPDDKFLGAIEGLTPEILRISRNEWGKRPIMRQVIDIIAEEKIAERRTALETCTPEEMPKLQGEIAGIREFLAAIHSQSKK